MRGKVRRAKIGLLHSLTGSMAVSERALLDAEQMAVEEINRDGGILGSLIEPVTVDGASDPETFSRRAQELIGSGINTLFGCWTSASRKAVKPLVEAADGLLWYPVQYEGLEESQNIVYTGSCLNQQIAPAVEWILGNIGPNIFLVGSDYIFPRAANLLIRSMVCERGCNIVGERYLALGEQDFRTVIDEIRQQKTSAVFNTLNGESNLSFYRQYHAAGIRAQDIPIMAVSASETEMQTIADLVAGHLACWSYFQSSDNAENRQFLARFRERYGANRVCSDPVIMAYTQIYLWKKAVELAGSFAPTDVRRHLVGDEMQSPAGPIAIQANHHVTKSACIGRSVAGGQFEAVWCSPEPIKPLPWLGLENIELPAKALIKQSMASFSESIYYGTVLEREIAKRQVLEEALRRSHDTLEARVKERTKQLREAVRNLKTEIMDHETAEIALKGSEAKYRALIEKLPAGVVVHGPDTTVMISNPMASTILGLTGDQMLGKTAVDQAWRFIREDGSPLPPDEYPGNLVTSTGKMVKNLVLGVCRPDSPEPLWALCDAYPVFDASGQLSQVIVSFIDISEKRRAEEEKRQFYRETIKSVTEGKLDLVSWDDVKEYLDSAELMTRFTNIAEASTARREIAEFCASKELSSERLELFEPAVGEAITNAIKHAQGGCVYAGVRGDSIWVAVSDRGPGISTLTLPGATLRRGFSTKASMGMGYTIMMEASDEIMLYTGSGGTTVALSASLAVPELFPSIKSIPSIWGTNSE